MKRVLYPVAASIVLLAAVARAAAPVRIDVASMEFARSRALGLESIASRPGTHLKLLLTHGDPDWRAIDFESSVVTSFRDDEGTSLAVPDASGVGETGTGIQPAGSRVTADGMSALLAIWGGGLPSGKADEIRVTGSAAIFCGPEREMTVDRADVRLAGGETFNVQPFRVVTARGDQTIEVELRFLRSDALVTNVLMMVGASRLPEARASKLTARGNEWIWQGEFVLPPGIPKGVLAIRYQPIERVETVPFDISVPLAFRTPPTNFIARWLRRFF